MTKAFSRLSCKVSCSPLNIFLILLSPFHLSRCKIANAFQRAGFTPPLRRTEILRTSFSRRNLLELDDSTKGDIFRGGSRLTLVAEVHTWRPCQAEVL